MLRFESAGQSLVIDGSLTVNELSTLDGNITVNGSLNGVGDIVIANFAEVSGTITGLVTVANGAQLEFLDGAISGPSTVLTNLGEVVVFGSNLLLANSVTIDNGGQWDFASDSAQDLQISVPDTSTFNNDGVVRKQGSGLTVLPSGFEFNMGDGAAIVVEQGQLRLFADGTWTGDELGIDVQSEIGTTFVWAGDQTLSGGISGTSSVDAVGKVVMSGTKTWAVPGGDEPRTNTLDFGHDPTAPASENYQLDVAAVTFLGEPFDIDGFARFIGGTSSFDTDAAINADIAVILLSGVTIDNEVTVTIRGDIELDGTIRTEEFFDDETTFFNVGVLVFDTESGPIDVSGTGTVDNRGEARTFGTDTTTVGPGVTWRSSSSGSLLVDEGELVLSGPVVYLDEDDEPGLLGYTFVGAGALLTVDGDLVLDVDSFVEIGINGPPTDASNYGRLSVGGTLTKGGGLSASGIQGSEPDYAPTVDDVFPIISCTDCYPGSFDFFGTRPLDAVPTATAITLQIVANKINQPDRQLGLPVRIRHRHRRQLGRRVGPRGVRGRRRAVRVRTRRRRVDATSGAVRLRQPRFGCKRRTRRQLPRRHDGRSGAHLVAYRARCELHAARCRHRAGRDIGVDRPQHTHRRRQRRRSARGPRARPLVGRFTPRDADPRRIDPRGDLRRCGRRVRWTVG